MNKYLFTSDRLGFRNWYDSDLEQLYAINSDPEVMEHFPELLSKKDTEAMIQRFRTNLKDHGYTYYAVELLEAAEWIGFIGLLYQEYEAPFTPATDIGWRLKRSAWCKGYATEGAQRCLDHAFDTLKIDRVVSCCTLQNTKSENVMQKIGMTKKGEFTHTKLLDFPDYARCVWYDIKNVRLKL